jgi:hypothetical protein
MTRHQKPPKGARKRDGSIVSSTSSTAAVRVKRSIPKATAKARTSKIGAALAERRPEVPSIKPPGSLPGPTLQQGSDGTGGFGGYWFSTGETNPALVGRELWRTYAEVMANMTIVATAIRYSLNLVGGVEWDSSPNPNAPDVGLAKKCAETIKVGLLDADMTQPFPLHAKKQALSGWLGFALHNWFWRKRSDGLIVISDLRHRPQATVAAWDIPVEGEPWIGIEQQTRSGGRYYVERSRLWYTADLAITDRPSGVGLLRHVVEHARQLVHLEEIEGFAFDANLRGVPIGRAPLNALYNYAKGTLQKDHDDAMQWVEDQTAEMNRMLANHSKTADQGFLLDSETYMAISADGAKTPSSVPKWAVDLLQGGSIGLEEVAAAIERKTREIARVMSFEWALLGEGDAGSNAMHVDKTQQYGAFLNALTTGLAISLRNDVARPLVAANHGAIAAEEATPIITPSVISTEDIRTFTGAILDLKQAGSFMPPNDPIFDVARKRMRAPAQMKVPPNILGQLMRPPLPPDNQQPPGSTPPPAPGAPTDPKPGKLPTRNGAEADPTAPDTGQLRQGGDSNTDTTTKRTRKAS